MGPGYAAGLTLDRIDNNSGYGPDNCRWTTPQMQSRNRRTSHFVDTPIGRMTVSEASHRFSIGVTTLLYRINRRVAGEDLFKKPNTTNRFRP